jgi:hypothetical protein
MSNVQLQAEATYTACGTITGFQSGFKNEDSDSTAIVVTNITVQMK